MLLATYALTTLTAEQSGERTSIDELQVKLASAATSEWMDCAAVCSQIEDLIRLAELRHRRRWEESLLPALRGHCAEARPSLRALEMLSRKGLEMLPALRASVANATKATPRQINELRQRINRYCQNLLLRLSWEDELLRLARAGLPLHVWIRVGKDFLSQDAERAA